MTEQLKLIDEPDYDPNLSQWFTPMPLAQKIMREWGELFVGRVVLEPSAGRGDLVRSAAMLAAGVIAIEIDERWSAECIRRVGAHLPIERKVSVITGDFFDHLGLAEEADIALMNPPYENGADLRFLLAVLEAVGEAVCVLRSDALAGVGRHEKLWSKYFLRRLAILPRRPAFSGQSGAQSDFCVTYIADEPGPQSIEWWLL